MTKEMKGGRAKHTNSWCSIMGQIRDLWRRICLNSYLVPLPFPQVTTNALAAERVGELVIQPEETTHHKRASAISI